MTSNEELGVMACAAMTLPGSPLPSLPRLLLPESALLGAGAFSESSSILKTTCEVGGNTGLVLQVRPRNHREVPWVVGVLG